MACHGMRSTVDSPYGLYEQHASMPLRGTKNRQSRLLPSVLIVASLYLIGQMPAWVELFALSPGALEAERGIKKQKASLEGEARQGHKDGDSNAFVELFAFSPEALEVDAKEVPASKSERKSRKQVGDSSNAFVELFALSPEALEQDAKKVSIQDDERKPRKRIGDNSNAFVELFAFSPEALEGDAKKVLGSKIERRPRKQGGDSSSAFVDLSLSPRALEADSQPISTQDVASTALESARRPSKRIGDANTAFAIQRPLGHDRREISRRFLGRPGALDEDQKTASLIDGIFDDILN